MNRKPVVTLLIYPAVVAIIGALVTWLLYKYFPKNGRPIAQMEWRINNKNPLMIIFNGINSSDPDGDDLSYAWILDGKKISGESTFRHVFEKPGGYTVLLIVTDEHGATDEASEILSLRGTEPAARHWYVEDAAMQHVQYMKADWVDVPGMKLKIRTDGGKLNVKWGLRLGSNHPGLAANARICVDGKESSRFVTIGDASNIKQSGVANSGWPGERPISADPNIGNYQRTRKHERQFRIEDLPAGDHTIQMQRCLTDNPTGAKVNTDFWWYSYERSITVVDD